MIDVFAQSQGIAMDRVHCKAIFGQGMCNLGICLFGFVNLVSGVHGSLVVP